MSLSSLLSLLILSAIWGASFLFMRIGVPILGPAYLVELRVAFAALFLFCLALCLKKDINFLRHWKHYLILGFLNSTFPFLLMAYSALTLPVSALSVLNATAPTWGLLIGIGIGNEKFSLKRILGLILGIIGVAILFSSHENQSRGDVLFPILFALLAAFSYGVATNYAKKAKTIEPFLNAYGSMVASTFLILPTLFFFPMRSIPTPSVMLCVILLGVVCSGIAYLIFFKLVQDLGPASALTVTFLVPIFATFFGYFVLGESIEWLSLLGMVVIVASTAFVTEFNIKTLFRTQT